MTQMKGLAKRKLAALPLSFVLLGSISHGAFAQMSGLGMDQDSLLPPEVVPVDPAVAARMARNQSHSQSSFDVTSESENVPGLVNTYQAGANNNNPYKQMHKAMNDSMHGRAAMPAFPNNQVQLNQINANMGGTNPYLVPMGTNPVPNQAAQDMANQNMVAVNSPISDGPGFGQSQTLTGGSTNPMVRRDTRRGGASNAFSSIPGLMKIPTTFLGPGIGFGGFAGGGR
jgi:hypothetical protein